MYEAAKQLSAIFQENPDYIELLSAPNLPKPERIALAKQALSGNVPDTLCAFVQLLCERGYLPLGFNPLRLMFSSLEPCGSISNDN